MIDSDEEDSEKALKVVLVGDSCCGKTALCIRFSEHTFVQKYVQTSGVDFYSKRIVLPSNTDVLLQLWDVGGHNIGSNMLNTYIFGAHAILFVYDVTNAQSFENICDWISIIKKISRQMEMVYYVGLVGSKTDMEHRRVVSIDKNNKAAEQYGLNPFYVSSKTGDNIELMFKTISAEILGIRLSRAEQEWNISVVQAQISGDNNAPRPVYPYYKNLHMGVINNQHENTTAPTAQLPALPNQQQEIVFENRNMGVGASTVKHPNPPTIPQPRIKFPLRNRNSTVCNIS